MALDFESIYQGSDLESLLDKHSKGELLEKTYTLLVTEPGTHYVEAVKDATVKRGSQVVKLEDFDVPVALENGPSVTVSLQKDGYLLVAGTITAGTEITYTATRDIVDNSAIVQCDWNEKDPTSKAFILGRTHYFEPYAFIVALPATNSSEGTIISYLGESFMLNGQVYNSARCLGIDISCRVSGPSVVVRVDYEEGEGYALRHISGVPVVEIPLCPAGRIITISDGFLPETVVRKAELGRVNGKSLLEGDITIEGGSSTINYDLNVKAVNHRGYSYEAPENTIPAYIMSKAKGFTYVEGDVSFTKDGVAVLLHDATIDRTSNGTGNINDLYYQEVLQYDFGSWYSEDFKGVKIPTFTEWITLCKNLGLHPYIELKSSGSYTQAQITQIVNEVEKCGMKGKVTYISFNNTFLGYVKNADAYARLGLLANPLNSSKISQGKALKLSTNEVFMDAKLSSVTESLIASCISNGLPLEVWTVNTEDEIKGMPAYVSGVTSDNIVAGKVLYENSLVYIPPTSNWVPTTGISLDKSTLTLTSFDPITLIATVVPSNSSEEVVWKSSNTSVATVNNGVVTPITDGDCTITATSGDFSASCATTVAFTRYSITQNLTGCSLCNAESNVLIGRPWACEITPNEGYSLKNGSVAVTMGGVDITSVVYNNGVISIESVTGDVVVTVVCVAVPVYSITRNLTGCTSNKSTTSIGEGNPYNEVFTPLEDYRLNGATVIITMGGTDISSMYAGGVLSIPEVTGNIVISITAAAIPVYGISRNLVNCSSDKTTSSIKDGESYTETITANEGYTLRGGNITVTMGGVDISSSLASNGVLTIEAVTGDISISVEAAKATGPQPIVDLSLTNVADGKIINLGTGGSTYDATISIPSSSRDSYAVSENGLILNNHAYANMPYGFKVSDKFTIIIKARITQKSSNTYQRVFRTDQDTPSLFYSTNSTAIGGKLAGKSGNGFTVHNDLGSVTGTNGALNTCYLSIYDEEGFDESVMHEYKYTSNGTTMKFYVDGVLIASQNASPLPTSTKIGLGDNDTSKNYYAKQIEVAMFRIYSVALTEEEVSIISGE